MSEKSIDRAAGFLWDPPIGRRSLQKGGNNELVHCTPNSNIVIFYNVVKLKIQKLPYKNLKKYLTENLQNSIFFVGRHGAFLLKVFIGGFYEGSHNKRQVQGLCHISLQEGSHRRN
jgi:hypothetical protein